jgi:ABC-2 type transport system permease protein
MIAHQLTLIRREVWEHPAIWVTPVVIALILSLLTLTGQVSVSTIGDGKALDLAIVGAQNVGVEQRSAVLTAVLFGVTTVFAVGAWIIIVFYCLDALYAERKDKSILFWRSLPITDSETVLSKLLTALCVIPLVTLLVAMAAHLLIMILFGIWVAVQGGDALHLIWGSARLADLWGACIVLALALPLWLSPFVGWFLFVSAFTKRSPLLTAFLPLLVLPMLENLVHSNLFFNAIFVRSVRPPIADFERFGQLEQNIAAGATAEPFSLMEQISWADFLSSPSLWAGIVVCGLLTAAAVYVRRYRDESY